MMIYITKRLDIRKKPTGLSGIGASFYLKNWKFIHSSTGKGVIVSDLNENYYTEYWISGGKIR